MRKIHSFKEFNFIYEAEVAGPSQTQKSKLYDQTLGMILTTILNSYSSLISYPTSSYDSKIDADLASVKSSPIGNKVAAFLKIMEKVKAAAANNKLSGAQEAIDAWIAVGSKAGEALSAMINQYKDQPEEQKYINDYINAALDNYLNDLEGAAEENPLKKDLAKKANESYDLEGDQIFEGIFQGKKGMIEDVSKQITIVLAKLAAFENTPGMADDVASLKNEVTQIAAQMGDLLDKKNSEIKKEDIKKASVRLSEIPTLLDKVSQTMLKQDTTNKEAASILVQALALVKSAKEKEMAYLSKKEEMEKEAAAKETVTYDKEKIKEVNPGVKKFQELVVDKFKNSKQISGLTFYKKMGTDGKYGPATKAMVQIMKSGFGLSDTSGETITRDLIKELEAQEALKESRIYTFGQFSFSIDEAFSMDKALEVSKTIPAPSVAPKSSSPASSSKVSKTETKTSSGRLLSIGSQESWDAVSKALSDKKVGTKAKWEKSTYAGRELWRGYYPANSADFIPETITILFKDGKGGDYLKSDPSKPLANYSWTWDSGKNNWEFLGTTYTDLGNKNKIGSLSSEEAIAIAKKIKDAADGGFGTNLNKFVSAVDAINSLGLLKAVEYQLSKLRSFTSSIEDSKLTDYNKKKIGGYKNNIQFYVNDEMGSDDYSAVKLIADALNKIPGVKATYTKDGDEFKEDSFKLTF